MARFKDELRGDKPSLYFAGITCVSVGFQIHFLACGTAGLALPHRTYEDTLIKAFLNTGFVFYLFAFLLAIVSLFKQTRNPRAALILCVVCTYIAVAFSTAGIIIYGEQSIDIKYNFGEFEATYEYLMYITASLVCAFGGLFLIFYLCMYIV